MGAAKSRLGTQTPRAAAEESFACHTRMTGGARSDGVEARVEEVRDARARARRALGRGRHTVRRRAQQAAGVVLERVAEVVHAAPISAMQRRAASLSKPRRSEETSMTGTLAESVKIDRLNIGGAGESRR